MVNTAVPRFVMEHQLKAYPLAEPVAHKKRPLTPDRRQALKEEVFNWLKEGIIRKVQYPGWVTNAMLIKQKSELKNSVATLQRMEEKNGRNIEVYLEEIVMKNRSEQSLIQDVEETVDKLRRVNVKIDPSKCTFGMEEGKFLGYLANISRFVPKLTELMHPIRNVRKSSDAKEGSNWMSGAEEAPQKIKRRLNKLQASTILKEREVLMICLRQGSETVNSVLFVERGRVQKPVSYISRPLQGLETCYTPRKKTMLTMIHTTRSLRMIFWRHKVRVVTDGPMEEMLIISGTEGRLEIWAAELRTYDVSCIIRKEVEGQVVRKFFKQGEKER
ncbi:reverse transcriptase domain-containing protein [Tanacetum coccineum]